MLKLIKTCMLTLPFASHSPMAPMQLCVYWSKAALSPHDPTPSHFPLPPTQHRARVGRGICPRLNPHSLSLALTHSLSPGLIIPCSTVRVWDVASEQSTASWTAHAATQGGVLSLATPLDHAFIVTAGGDGLVRQWRLPDGALMREFKVGG